MGYTLFVDESGDEGISNIRTKTNPRGSSPLFFLGALLVSDDDVRAIRNRLSLLEAEIGRLHCSQLSHDKVVYFCKLIAQLPIVCFGLISDKSGLYETGYIRQASPERFYNKNVKYLCEKVGEACSNRTIEANKLVFEKKANKDYNKLSNFLRTVRTTPFYPQSRNLMHVAVQNTEARDKADESILAIADALAYSLFKASVPNRFGFTEHRYLTEMKDVFYNVEGCISGNGIVTVRSFASLSIDNLDRQFLLSLNTSVRPLGAAA